jgi:hypothetical protein
MGIQDTTKIVLGSLRYQSSPDVDSMVNVAMQQQLKDGTEFERSEDVNLAQVFDDERQFSDIFRPSTKVTFLFNNSYVGQTTYRPFRDNLYYVNAVSSTVSSCSQDPSTVYWSGYPQYYEFDLTRNDNHVSGYTEDFTNPATDSQNVLIGFTPAHVNFENIKSDKYNWNFYMSYPYENDYTKQMRSHDSKSPSVVHNWVVADGLPFIIDNTTYNGQSIISFRSPCKHGLSAGEYVKLSINYNGESYFQVDSLGDGNYNSEEYVFNIFDVGYLGGTFGNGVTGTFKRVINIENAIDTTSTYYVRRHKILTNKEDAVMVNSGFEWNPFPTEKQFENFKTTPNKLTRVSIKDGNQSYTLSFNKDILIKPLRDNQKRPLTDLYFTFLYVGYFGWTLEPTLNGVALRQGFEFNLPLVNGLPNAWWSSSPQNQIPASYTSIQTNSYVKNGTTFYYNNSLQAGDIIDGAFCEWNSYDLIEREISQIYHKYTFNSNLFNINIGEYAGLNNNQFGYYYNPYSKLNIRAYSEYIEEAERYLYDVIPDYSLYSESSLSFRWRDIYTYGFVDGKGVGVDYPFLNGAHYPYKNTIFRLIPEGSNASSFINIIQSPTVDDCE